MTNYPHTNDTAVTVSSLLLTEAELLLAECAQLLTDAAASLHAVDVWHSRRCENAARECREMALALEESGEDHP